MHLAKGVVAKHLTALPLNVSAGAASSAPRAVGSPSVPSARGVETVVSSIPWSASCSASSPLLADSPLCTLTVSVEAPADLLLRKESILGDLLTSLIPEEPPCMSIIPPAEAPRIIAAPSVRPSPLEGAGSAWFTLCQVGGKNLTS
eukprot:scaffold193440_cov26-Tisochrysis_lutea.AAC.5